MKAHRSLIVPMYHYIRDFESSDFPDLKGMSTDDFVNQIMYLSNHYEIATLDSARSFLMGDYHPSKDLCLLTFDDGLLNHYDNVLPVLKDYQISGVFFLSTGCLESSRVLNVHKNHFLLAKIGFDNYKAAFLDALANMNINIELETSSKKIRNVYRWDSLEIASFKYLVNYQLSADLRSKILQYLFNNNIGDESSFSKSLYLQWPQAIEMQKEGMIIGGHSHEHTILSDMNQKQQEKDLTACINSLKKNLLMQKDWPFSYPYGKKVSFNRATVKILQSLDFKCAFSSEVGKNNSGCSLFTIKRVDPKDIG